MLKRLTKELHQELLVAHKRLHELLWAKNLEKNKARLTYEKLQLIKARKPTTEVETKLKALESGKIEFPPLDESKANNFVSGDEHHLANVVCFLKNQRVYNELLERYNPGLTMSQEDNVRKTANMVGLAVPERK